MSSNSSQLKEFHKQLIYLGSKHPEQTEILEFIVSSEYRKPSMEAGFHSLLKYKSPSLLADK